MVARITNPRERGVAKTIIKKCGIKYRMEYIGILIYIIISYLIADKIGRHKKIGFLNTFLLCLFTTPFIGYLIAEGGGRSNAKGCKWCGNKENEAEFCGLCGKNDDGETRPNFKGK